MLARIRKAMKEKDQGFTLIELLVVIIIIGILAAIAIPVFLNQRQKGWESAVTADLRNAATAEETVLTSANAYTSTIADLEAVGFKYSDDKNYDGGTAVITATVNGGLDYCLTATANGGTQFFYSSEEGFAATSC